MSSGIWNETEYDAPWIKVLRRTLDRKNLANVKIVAADVIGNDSWKIVDKLTDIVADNGVFTLAVDPDSVYSLTTTTGQQKVRTSSPSSAPFSMPYHEDFADLISVEQIGQRITGYKLQYLAGSEWRDLLTSKRQNEDAWTDHFPPVESAKVRIMITQMNGTDRENSTPSICELGVFNTQ